MTRRGSRGLATPAGKPSRDRIFISYSHKDKKMLDRLLVHLNPLERAGLTEVWSDKRIDPGDRWREEIELAIASAQVAILLVSIDFLTSEFITRNELPPLLRAAEHEGVWIVPVIIQPCLNRFRRTPALAAFQAVNDPAQPLAALKPFQREAFWDGLADRVQDYLVAAVAARR